ncbi:hypothetical protein C9374_007680 [Naegleria lovaniensis]|uniref:Uncharacterized protein n=1 Tax=Naegleria lovaniensis TaxID=51637 RepID=A0AA88KDG7_NAELO|nr:uncharacterized protein C9374_014704 [Naegleria lovaniensis]XP_044546304.1 uncharacterized protein C9374_007680 [Naegleria lovaniensis]KAG2370662.1 hypothetical protein C9374_014704 [Naegleria lovaniensis]KAG2379042.1 hypothetical protein C9374_007680 [Naegleria lovaniensis]
MCFLLMVLFSFLTSTITPQTASYGTIGGQITIIFKNQDQYKALMDVSSQSLHLRVSVFRLDIVQSGNSTYPYIPDIVEITTLSPLKTSVNNQIVLLPSQQFPASLKIPYRLDDLPLASYIVLGQIVSGHQSLTSFNGWYRGGGAEYFKDITLSSDNSYFLNADFVIEGATPYPASEKFHSNGHFRFVKGLPVLSLFGNEKERGVSHGYLLAQQIIDFFRFYVLEGAILSAKDYLNIHVPVLSSSAFKYDKEFIEAVEGIYSGMIASGIDLFVPELNRKFQVIDVIAINAYIELEYIASHGVPNIASNNYLTQSLREKLLAQRPRSALHRSKPHAACTQFSVWNEFTSTNCPPEQQNNIISVRNMDGEIDMKRVTVHAILLSTIESTNSFDRKYISVMWPGFVGTLSAINEDGVYSMMNYGRTHPNTTWSSGAPVSWILKEVIQKTSLELATPSYIQQFIEKNFRSQPGGACLTGCILVFSHRITSNSSLQNSPPSFVYESDWKGGMMRLPQQAFPRFVKSSIGASNHNHLYGVESGDRDSTFNFGIRNGFSSMWRYQVTSNLIDVWARSVYSKVQDPNFCNSQMREILRRAAHGQTEHSIMFRPLNNGKIFIDIAVAQATFNGWDAPYLDFVTFEFNDLFTK